MPRVEKEPTVEDLEKLVERVRRAGYSVHLKGSGGKSPTLAIRLKKKVVNK